jgi:putative phosphoesterase
VRILVISDTHIPIVARELPAIIEEEAAKSDCIIHAGDFVSLEVFECLSKIAKVYGVCGNMDNADVAKKFAEKQTIEIENIHLGLIHGRGSPSGLMEYIKKEFGKDFAKLDIVVFGHTHYPTNKEIGGKIYFNPGSATDKVFTPYRSYGILEISGKNIKRRLIEIK